MGRERIRVLTLIDTLRSAGGAERIAATTTAGLDPTRFERWICATRPTKGPLVDSMRESGVRVVALERKSSLDLRAWWSLVRLLRRERIDVLHAHGHSSNAWGVLVGRLARVPVIVCHEHTWSYSGDRLRMLVDRELIARGSDAFVAVSREDRRRMHELEGIEEARTRLVANGIPPLPPGDPKRVRGELEAGTDAVVVGAVTVLRPQKALHVLIEAVSLLRPRDAEVILAIAGSGPDYPRLRSLAGPSVRFLGNRSDVPDVLAAYDVAALSSDFEGSPLGVMEYMAAERAIVATRVGGVPDLIEDGVHGLLVPPRDPTALAAAIDTLVDDAALRRRLGAAAGVRQRAEFTIETTVRRLESLYEELLERKRGRS
ncbi:MAG: glycosyltransferase [Actinobacteria bacterium]|nr:glycosyltransferase [Actinomycetota bacterium]